MRFFDFDNNAPDRRGTASYKWDSAESADILPLWVADMDFRTAPPIVEALRRRVDHGVFGYERVPEVFYEAVMRWFDDQYGWRIERDSIMYTSGVVPALSAVIKALCPPGSGIIVQTPVYNCFFSSIRNNNCYVVENPLLRVKTMRGFSYRMDFEGLERLAAKPENRALLLCNPHNPAGRCWTAGELATLADICNRYGVTIISDEIHCGLTMPGFNFTPLESISPLPSHVVCNSPSKSFNLAGLQIANIICPDPDLRVVIDRAININEVCDVNPFGVEALIAAYTNPDCEAWLRQLCDYVHANYIILHEYLARELPSLVVADLEATYLAWIDVSATGHSGTFIEDYLKSRHGVWFNGGGMYGCDDFIRVNLACPESRLREALERMTKGIKELL